MSVKSLTNPLFSQYLIHANIKEIKENSKTSYYRTFVIGGFSQIASYAQNVSMTWRHHQSFGIDIWLHSISMGQRKKDLTPLLTYCYVILALANRSIWSMVFTMHPKHFAQNLCCVMPCWGFIQFGLNGLNEFTKNWRYRQIKTNYISKVCAFHGTYGCCCIDRYAVDIYIKFHRDIPIITKDLVHSDFVKCNDNMSCFYWNIDTWKSKMKQY